MATTFTTTKTATGVQPRAGIDVTGAWAEKEISAALVVNDVIQMVKIPNRATILEVILATDDLDQSTGLRLAVGDGSDVDRFISADDVGEAGGFVRLNNITGFLHQYSAEDTIDIKATVAPGSGQTSGTLKLCVMYSMNN